MEFHLLSNTITRNSIERLNLPQFCIIAGEPRASAPPLPLRDYTTHGDATIAAPSRGFHFQQLQPAPKLAPRDEIGRACTSHGTRKFGARGGERERSYRRRGAAWWRARGRLKRLRVRGGGRGVGGGVRGEDRGDAGEDAAGAGDEAREPPARLRRRGLACGGGGHVRGVEVGVVGCG
jgi:hypothetical protein